MVTQKKILVVLELSMFNLQVVQIRTIIDRSYILSRRIHHFYYNTTIPRLYLFKGTTIHFRRQLPFHPTTEKTYFWYPCDHFSRVHHKLIQSSKHPNVEIQPTIIMNLLHFNNRLMQTSNQVELARRIQT